MLTKPQMFWIITGTSIRTCYNHYGVFARLLFYEDLDCHQNFVSSTLYHPGPVLNLSLQCVHNFLNNVARRHTHRQTNKQTNSTQEYRNIRCLLYESTQRTDHSHQRYSNTVSLYSTSIFTHSHICTINDP